MVPGFGYRAIVTRYGPPRLPSFRLGRLCLPGCRLGGMSDTAPALTGTAAALALTGCLWAHAIAQEPAATEPLALSDHVTVVLQGQPGAQSNVGIVVGSFHPEHMMGESGFPPSAIVVRSMGQQLDIDATGAAEGRGVVELFRRMPNRAADMEGAVYRSPDVTFEGDTLVDLGGTRVRLMELGPAHTRGDVGFHVEGDGVVFTGDVAMEFAHRHQIGAVHVGAHQRQRLAGQSRAADGAGATPRGAVPRPAGRCVDDREAPRVHDGGAQSGQRAQGRSGKRPTRLPRP